LSLRKPKEFEDCAQPREPCAQNTKTANSAKGRIKITYRSALDAAGPWARGRDSSPIEKYLDQIGHWLVITTTRILRAVWRKRK
jgi:hypothetical protein